MSRPPLIRPPTARPITAKPARQAEVRPATFLEPYLAPKPPQLKDFTQRLPWQYHAGTTRNDDPEILDVFHYLKQREYDTPADNPLRAKEAIRVLTAWKKKLQAECETKGATHITGTQDQNTMRIIDALLAQLSDKSIVNPELVEALFSRISSSAGRKGFDVVCQLEGDGWPTAVGKTIHVKCDTPFDLNRFRSVPAYRLERVAAIIRNQRGLVKFKTQPGMFVTELFIDLVDGDEEDGRDVEYDTHEEDALQRKFAHEEYASHQKDAVVSAVSYGDTMKEETVELMQDVVRHLDLRKDNPADASLSQWLEDAAGSPGAAAALLSARNAGDSTALAVVAAVEQDHYLDSIEPAHDDDDDDKKRDEHMMKLFLLVLDYPHYRFPMLEKVISRVLEFEGLVNPTVTRTMVKSWARTLFERHLAKSEWALDTAIGRLGILDYAPNRVTLTRKWMQKVFSGEITHAELRDKAIRDGHQFLHLAAALTAGIHGW